ncbi:DUF4244 domain-containing protein [Agromyces albus]|uniref:DUF4244 domain-containing protein n=1 Tax=Agromyces albus TaxID=205332 RepID=UPI00278A47B1|nr:DUF4244 domain-containing protein [Agromyces albus]MDQ0574585.1 hypothetical protein [Agromyces albus]
MHELATPIEAVERDSSSAIPGHRSPRRCIRAGLRTVARRLAGERGAATAEYAVATMAAVGFAGLLVLILRGDEVRGILTDLVRNALTVG